MFIYRDTVQQLFELQKFSIKMGLSNITELCNFLESPQNKYPTIHVAGTNGKGSTCIVIKNILSAHGLKCGLYTSPHLVDFRERIRINDELIQKEFIIDFWKNISESVKKLNATFFDATTAMAFKYFEIQKVDVAIIETGLGGRLDSTNIISPEAVVITPIARDHIKQLGTKTKGIVTEKAAIIKNGSTFFCGRQSKEVLSVLQNYESKAAKSYYFQNELLINISKWEKLYSNFDFTDKLRKQIYYNCRLDLPGFYQVDNALLAYLVSRWYLEKKKIIFEEEKFRSALISVQWAGRLQLISQKPEIYFDVSHNLAGLKATLSFVKKFFDKKRCHLLIGLLEDKEYELIAKRISKYFSKIVVTEPVNQRALRGTILQKSFARMEIETKFIKDIKDAFEFSIKYLPADHILFVMGSHFLIGNLLKVLAKKRLT